MQSFLQIFFWIPLLGVVLNSILPAKSEGALSKAAFTIVGLQLLSILVFTGFWIYRGFPTLNTRDISLFRAVDYVFFIDFYFDKITAVYLLVGAFITFLVTTYSRFYMHREIGFKRFFNTILLFYLGYNLTIISGNLETLFIGWEILGISSFLLIAFYRHRYLPVKNAVKVFSIYRIGDVGLILAMWATHHFWHENITFLKLNNYELVNAKLQAHSLVGVFISIMILMAAAAKSAQLPFSSWLPRAMEGPTPSSAIFYGSLSVHIGVFLLLRTFAFWEHQLSVRILIGILGLCTSIVSGGIARVQSSVKSQIAYASISQIGLIFIEVAAGFENLALIHFAGNAFLRTYQLLVSPSVVTYLIRQQFYNFVPRPLTLEDSLPKKIENSFYILCLKEWNLDSLVYRLYWKPFKSIGRRLDFLTVKQVILFMVPVYLIGLYLVYNKEMIPEPILEYMPFVFAFIGLLLVLKSFAEKKNAMLGWILVNMNHFWVALAIAFNDNFDYNQVYFYLSGIVICGTIGLFTLRQLKHQVNEMDLDHYHGHGYKHPKLALLFLLACLGVTGFPITPTFIGEDLMFSHIHYDQVVLAFFISLSFIIDGLSIIRIYARLFMGPHVESPYEMAYKSS